MFELLDFLLMMFLGYDSSDPSEYVLQVEADALERARALDEYKETWEARYR